MEKIRNIVSGLTAMLPVGMEIAEYHRQQEITEKIFERISKDDALRIKVETREAKKRTTLRVIQSACFDILTIAGVCAGIHSIYYGREVLGSLIAGPCFIARALEAYDFYKG